MFEIFGNPNDKKQPSLCEHGYGESSDGEEDPIVGDTIVGGGVDGELLEQLVVPATQESQ